MKSKLIFGSLLAFVAASCANASEPSNYSLTVNLTPDEDGSYVYIFDYDTRAKVDSALVDNGIAKFEGNITNPFYARLLLDGDRIGDLIIEPATISVSPATRSIESDGKLNVKMQEMNSRLMALAQEYRSLPNDSASAARAKKINDEYTSVLESTLKDNTDNALGYIIFIETISGNGDLSSFDNMLNEYPQFADFKRVKSLRENLVKKEETSVGHKYKDFEITYDGKTERLSDYVGNGHYTLVDFWASWCGPCIRETKVIKELYDKYNGKGLEFLGVAVWDEPENTKKAIETHNLPWHSILNAQTIPTDLYGISGIPCIILIDPEGNIVSRDKQDNDLVSDVDAAMAKFKTDKESEEKSDNKAE